MYISNMSESIGLQWIYIPGEIKPKHSTYSVWSLLFPVRAMSTLIAQVSPQLPAFQINAQEIKHDCLKKDAAKQNEKNKPNSNKKSCVKEP